MNRRRFLQSSFASAALGIGGLGASKAAPAGASPTQPEITPYRNLLVLIELKGGNDGLNTVVPFAEPAYQALRPKLAIPRDAVVQLSARTGLHPALAPLKPLWGNRELAILQGVGYPEPNLSHFRSIESWDTASASEIYLQDGWLTRTFAATPPPRSFAADGVIVGSNDPGPLAGSGTRAVALANAEQFLRRARLAAPAGTARNGALERILKVEADIVQAASHLDARRAFRTEFPAGAFGSAIHTACQVIANPSGVAVVRVTIGGFDTHGAQAPTQARLLGALAGGIVALRSALVEIGRWDSTLVLTYAEFGRRPRENLSNGTDHGTASVHFALGGRVAGGFYGETPRLDRLGGDGNTGYALDFRSVYATVLERWWSLPAAPIVGGRFPLVPFVRA
jgi:uncharacterized protein (DUF1501 family)